MRSANGISASYWISAALAIALGIGATASLLSSTARSDQAADSNRAALPDAALQLAQSAEGQGPSAANSFNRLLKARAATSNAKPADDGIHDPQNPGTQSLQWPSEAFQDLPKSNDGNHVDWVAALDQGRIVPMVDLNDPQAEPFLMDLVIVRQVKGSMPNVVFPHAQHTQWLDCTNCHDEIFVPQKGANQISMAAILLGQKCGVCHGRVAFPVTDCRRCHAQPKTPEELQALSQKSAWEAGN